MATYFWVGGSGTWNSSSATNGAILTGGAGGTAVFKAMAAGAA